MTLAVIGGTGLDDFPFLQSAQKQIIKTNYGKALVYRCQAEGGPFFFLPRHGPEHSLPPHLINYRANICALVKVGVKRTLSLCSVGSLDKDIPPGSMVLCEQFIDRTWGRESTFAEVGNNAHVEMSAPFCPSFTDEIASIARKLDIALLRNGVYICTQGPRLETPAEIRAYAMWGANLVGMTAVPECPLAREAGLCYASLAVVGNYAAGIGGMIDLSEIEKISAQRKPQLAAIINSLLAQGEAPDCSCRLAKIVSCRNWDQSTSCI